MIEITSFLIEGREGNVITDNPRIRFSFSFRSDRDNVSLSKAIISLNGWSVETDRQTGIYYEGEPFEPFTTYTAKVKVVDSDGEEAEREASFETGRKRTPWIGTWITDGSYEFTEKQASPEIMVFRKRFSVGKKVKSAKLYSTVLGIYDVNLNGNRIFNKYFAPGFTSYEHQLQYQIEDITSYLKDDNEIYFILAGGWAVGAYVMNRANRIYADRQALLCEIRIRYEDGTEEVIGSDESFEVNRHSPYLDADLYNGESYDARIDYRTGEFHSASLENVKINPMIVAEYGAPVIAHERLQCHIVGRYGESTVYDFDQNFAGVVSLKIRNAKEGQKIVIRHAEILKEDGHVCTAILRSAKQIVTYICKEGDQEYSPTFTYMGFRYIEVEGIDPEDIEIEAIVLYSDIKQCGSFECDDDKINRLQQNIVWSSKSNFVDIPTDCPQRDERMGWTGDIALFAKTGTYNFRLNQFLEKWLLDMKSEQKKSGAIPTTIPHKGYGFPLTFPTVATDFWGDACVLVPYAIYQATGEISVLDSNFDMMKKYVDACKWWANLLSVGKRRYIWSNISFIHFGDWVAPGESMAECQGRHKWTATASLYNTSNLVSQIAHILGKEEDSRRYADLASKVASAYQDVFFDNDGKLRKKEFQTGYVLPLYFGMLDEEMAPKAAAHLAELVKKDDYKVYTGFPGTPYLLFALADNGYEKEALKMLLQEKDPSWLHEVVTGGTTIWERFDGLDDDGKLNVPEDGTGGMISFNHYSFGAVGDFLYRRILGLEAVEPGYRSFVVKPMLNDHFNHCEGNVTTPYGEVKVSWKKENGVFDLSLDIPCSSSCTVILPGYEERFTSGHHLVKVNYDTENEIHCD